MTHHGNPVLAGLSNRLDVPKAAQRNQWPLATLQGIRFTEQTTNKSFDMLALAIN